MRHSRRWIHGWLSAVSLLLVGAVSAAETVKVGGAHFPPYVDKSNTRESTGLLPQLLEALNQEQSDYHFTMLPTAIVRRFGDLQRGRIDMAIFENPSWGWQDIDATAVDMGLEDAELFVARDEELRGQEYFDQLQGKRLALYRGYHYGFADFNSDPEFLTRTYNANLGHSHDSNLLMVLRGRADIALVTRSNLYDFIKRNREHARALLISERIDQVYHHHAMVRAGSPISPEAFAALLERLRAKGELERIFSPYRIAVMPVVVGSSAAARAED
ncbi:Bacterial extracellular solute-binding protein, family 3 [Pseudomonas sp. THAF187a]|nr:MULTISPECIES: transporter substrate-binding domain-containing protein [unclassified Pseudomonas]QFT21908.1 Bacterial extracellular solute-binding protein, family 3 [Pseudomonas sp. THAF187a]QFT42095.1 Bacterial extracellular solute-binding protein, family 3 [Pseudomonas sp. THAF42]